MQNVVCWFEIPVSDFQRAVKFYGTIFDVQIKEVEMFDIKMGIFPTDGKNVSGALVKGDDYIPSDEGALVYLNGGDNLQVVLDRISENNGQIIVQKTKISPEMGFFAIFIDTEGNMMALHSLA